MTKSIDAGAGRSGNAKRKSGTSEEENTQVSKKRELDRLAQKKSREKARNRILEMEEKLNRLQSDDKQQQISDLLKEVDELKRENKRLRAMREKVLSLTNTVGPPLKNKSEASNCRRKSESTAPASEYSDESRSAKIT